LWEDHLLPLLTAKDAARLGTTCRALRMMVREHSRDLGSVRLDLLKAALTTFPRVRSMVLHRSGLWSLPKERVKALVEWLRRGGHGRGITTLTARGGSGVVDLNGFVHTAVRRGALPSLRSIAADLDIRTQRASLTGGRLRGMHKLCLWLTCKDESSLGPQLTALGLVRQLPALATLKIFVTADGSAHSMEHWPPFISPSLKNLSICVRDAPRVDLSFLGALPGMLGVSGARLERLEIGIHDEFENLEEGLIHVAQALRCCRQTLKGFCLSTDDDGPENTWRTDEKVEQGKRLRAQWADVLAGVCLPAASSRCSCSRAL
jgi:hypothetical protein